MDRSTRPGAAALLALLLTTLAGAEDGPGAAPLGQGARLPPGHPATVAAPRGIDGLPVLSPRPPRMGRARSRRALARLLRRQPRAPGADRHALGDRLHDFLGVDPSAPLVIAFEGTGAYEPRMPVLMQQAHTELLDELDADARDHIHADASRVFEEVTGAGPKWSGLRAGPFAALFRAPSMVGGSVAWRSFPSEEAELLAGTDGLTLDNLLGLRGDIERSTAARPRAVTRALRFTTGYLRAAVEAGGSPRVVVLGHSSGCRAAVKFMHLLQRRRDPRTGERGVQVDLAFTFDPVREAHEALLEVAGQIGEDVLDTALDIGLGGVGRLLRRPPSRPRPLLVRSRRQPESLYKPENVTTFLSVHQRKDTLGLKMEPRFGIHGSPIAGADLNLELADLGDDGHGAICYHDVALELLGSRLRALSAGAAPP